MNMLIRSWEVLDTRCCPASVYDVQVVRKGRLFKIVQRAQVRMPGATKSRISEFIIEEVEKIDPTSYTDRELCESMALAFVLCLEDHGCVTCETNLETKR
jgi:hypothetical protein